MTSKNTASGDDRFSKVKKDPRFWEMPNKERKIKIDKRFQSMFHDERFKLKYTVDKRGRPVKHTSTEDLKRFYKLSDSEQSDDEDEDEEKTEVEQKEKRGSEADKEAEVKEDDDDEEEEEESDESEQEEEQKIPKNKEAKKTNKGVRVYEEDEDVESGVEEEEEEDDDDEDEESDSGPDLARGKGNIETSSDEDEDDDEGDEVEDVLQRQKEEIEHDWGEMWKDAPRSDDTSRRLAVCNMDWDRLKAKDLLALFNSFKPKGGVVLSVTVYPSEFGKERIHTEQTQGPLELSSLSENPDADTDEQRIYREKVRDYQFKRLRYYYAVVECDSVETASKIYEECDGIEYETSCSMIDLRFIPDDVTFEDEPKDRATDVDYGSYKPKLFTSTATTTSKVELTWDETDHDRVSALCRKFNKDELLDMDFKAYLASSSEEEEDEGEQTEAVKPVESLAEEKTASKEKKGSGQIDKYRELLKSIQDKDKKEDDDNKMNMEITWVPGLKESTENLVKKKMMGKDRLTPWEEFLEKKKEKKKEKRKGKKEVVETELQISDDELPPDVDLSDPFFTEELGSSESLKNKKSKKNRKKEEDRTPEEQEKMERQKAEMELLMDDDEDDKHKHFNYDKIVEHQNLSKKKRKKLLKSNTPLEEGDDFKVDVQDPRFQAMFTSHLYNLDPSDPAYKKTKATQSILEEKQRRREEKHSQEETRRSKHTQEEDKTHTPSAAAAAMDPSLSLLIKSVKNKTQQFQARKKQKTK
ncbi:ESF1 homolog [Danio aesculapii]|uniref:ESF1 homolog n=1 Tax=Danio aesculapii TaxID=1142201 RepID=UPI0024BF5F6B|nr:ESF1 homolog [Danio aesculapii]